MKTTLITALGMLMAGAAVSQAQTLAFDSQAAFDSHFTRNTGTPTYSAVRNGLVFPGGVQTSMATLGNGSYNPGEFLTESVSTTFSVDSFGVNTSVGLFTRGDADSASYTTMTGITALVNLESANLVRLRIASGVIYNGLVIGPNLTFNTSANPLVAGQKFVFTLEQQNITVGSDIQAQFRAILTNESGSIIYGDTDWRNVTGVNTYTEEGLVGMRIYPNPATANVTVYDFTPAPIPEPSTMVLLGGGLLFGAWMRRRQIARRM